MVDIFFYSTISFPHESIPQRGILGDVHLLGNDYWLSSPFDSTGVNRTFLAIVIGKISFDEKQTARDFYHQRPA